MPTVAFYTLGCKVNSYETEAMWAMFEQANYHRVNDTEVADVYIIQTCTVTNIGDRKSRQAIRRVMRTNPLAVIVVTGCYAQTSSHELASIPEIDIIIGTHGREKLVDYVEKVLHRKGLCKQIVDVTNVRKQRKMEELPVPVSQGKVRAFLKIQDGCDNFCTFCIIPWSKGRSRSQDPKLLLKAAHDLVNLGGYKEIVLTGIHTGGYGDDFKDYKFFHLLDDLSHIEGIKRLRISSIEINQLTPDILTLMRNKEIFCHHLHIPLQAGHDDILKKMRRRYTVEEYRDKIAAFYQAIPGLAITTDVIVGFPGETDDHFMYTYNLIKELKFTRLHVFPYSMRHGTPAARMENQVDPAIKKSRVKKLIDLSHQLSLQRAQDVNGNVYNVIPEMQSKENQKHLIGYTDTYLKVSFEAQKELIGQICPVKIEKPDAICSYGRLVDCC